MFFFLAYFEVEKRGRSPGGPCAGFVAEPVCRASDCDFRGAGVSRFRVFRQTDVLDSLTGIRHRADRAWAVA